MAEAFVKIDGKESYTAGSRVAGKTSRKAIKSTRARTNVPTSEQNKGRIERFQTLRI